MPKTIDNPLNESKISDWQTTGKINSSISSESIIINQLMEAQATQLSVELTDEFRN
jgi:hypothetical protein